VNSATRWVICPTDGQTHSLLPVGDHSPGMLAARCGHLLPVGVAQYEQLPGWQLCVSCLWRYLVPTGVFPPESPAGRRSNPEGAPPCGVPSGQPVPVADAEISAPGCPVLPLPRWARCPLDQHVHLLSPEVVAVAGGEGHGYAGCGRGIPVVGSKAGICLGCIAPGSGTTW
jgi:hypothetical protein